MLPRTLLIAALILQGCSPEPGPASTAAWPLSLEGPGAAAPRFERVVLVSIDTLRADHLSCYGYKRRTSAFLDQLADEGVLFERAMASVSHTSPSHATMLTGLPPALHGVLENGARLGADAADLPTLFEAAGFETAAFLNVQFLAGIATNFGHTDVALHQGGLVLDAALAWLQERRQSERFFLWVHFYDPHGWKQIGRTPRDDHRAFKRKNPLPEDDLYAYLEELHGLLPQADDGSFDLGWVIEETDREGHTVEHTADRRADYLAFVDSYDARIHYTDRLVRLLYKRIEELALPGRTLWIVTSDHGEGLASHQIAGHGGRIYQEQLHVPLIVHASDKSLGPHRVPDLVQHIDLLPTLAATLGTRVSGRGPLLEGRSLWPLIDQEDAWTERHAFAQRRPFPKGTPDSEDMYALQSERYKLILREPGDDEFYDLVEDPLEQRDRGGEPSSERDQLMELLKARLNLYRIHGRGSIGGDIPEEWRKELQGLGYAR